MSRRLLSLAGAVALVLAFLSLPGRAPVASATQADEPENAAALQNINLYRSWLGLAPLVVDPALQRAAEAHVEYYRLNYGDPSLAGMGLHYETPGRPGFTGEDFQDRADYQGYDGWVNENAGLSGSMLWSLDWFIGTVGHRLTLLDPRYTKIGLAAVDQGDIVFEIIDLGSGPTWDYTLADPLWTAWPPNGATGVGLTFEGEAPNPFPDADYPVGYPITLKYFGEGDLTLTRATIATGGQAVPSFATIGDGWLTRKTVQLCASAPLELGTTYDVEISGTANGQPFTQRWSFTTTNGDDPLALNGESGLGPDDLPPPTPPPGNPSPTPQPPPGVNVPTGSLPPGVASAEPAVQELWWTGDGPVATDQVKRSWLWGPDIWLGTLETALEAEDGRRQVYYLDKARIEVNEAEDGSAPTITAGLLARDMIAGQLQIGISTYQPYHPADVPLAGDPLKVNPDAPTYASLNGLAAIEPGREAPVRTGQPIGEVLWKSGEVSELTSLRAYATYGFYEPTLGHNVAAVFADYFRTLPVDWMVSVGLPLSEPYWVRTMLAGKPEWVLVQAFERRVLTFTPSNAPGWQVEMGNIGRHYYTWRYEQDPPSDPQAWLES